jgi:putative nucleotidyltransferase with HDIG domain
MNTLWPTKETGNMPWARLRLPPFSPVALRVLQLANSESVQLHELSELISSDPALSSEVLAIVNSLVYAPRFPINSILQSIAVIGATRLQGLCLVVGVRAYMGKPAGKPAMQALWRHSLACAIIAEQLAGAGFIDSDNAFTGGIMHDIGRLALSAVRPTEYNYLLESYAGSSRGMMDREREVFGMDHCEVGNRLVTEWNLPEDFRAIVAGHHTPCQECKCWDIATLVGLSCRIADSAGFAAFRSCEPAPFDALLLELPANERKLFYADVESLVLEITAKIKAIESI